MRPALCILACSAALIGGPAAGQNSVTPGAEGPALRTPYLDTERADGAVTLRWAVSGNHFQMPGDFDEPEPVLTIAVEVLWSATSPDELEVLTRVPAGGPDPERGAFTATRLMNGAVYHFAVRFTAEDGRVGRQSNTVAVSPGPAEIIEAELPPGAFGDWSPDGRTLALANSYQPDGTSRLALYDLASGETRPISLIGYPRLQPDYFPRWSPDGTHLVFTSGTGRDVVQVFTVEVETGGVTQVTTVPTLHWAPEWSPVDDRLAFVARSPESGFAPRVHRIAVASARGGPVDLITNGPRNDVDPTWSPDGERIYFLGYHPEADGRAIYVVPTSGGVREVVVGPEWEPGGPAASPDGRWLAFTSGRSGHSEVWALDLRSRAFRQLTGTTIRNASSPVWSPTGDRLLVRAQDETFEGRIQGGVGSDAGPYIFRVE